MTGWGCASAIAGHTEGAQQIGVLGDFRLSIDGRDVYLPDGCRRVLGFLALTDRPVARRVLAGTLWPDAPDVRATGNLRCALWRLRQAAPGLVHDRQAALWVDTDVDVHTAVALANRILAPAPAPAPAPIEQHTVTLNMLRYDVLPNWDDEWVNFERELFRQLRLQALETMCLRLRDEGRIAESLQVGTEVVFADQMRESAHRVLIAAYLAQGNTCEALRQYRTFLAIARDCGIPPSPLITRLMAGVAKTKRPVPRPAAGTLPRSAQSRRLRRLGR